MKPNLDGSGSGTTSKVNGTARKLEPTEQSTSVPSLLASHTQTPYLPADATTSSSGCPHRQYVELLNQGLQKAVMSSASPLEQGWPSGTTRSASRSASKYNPVITICNPCPAVGVSGTTCTAPTSSGGHGAGLHGSSRSSSEATGHAAPGPVGWCWIFRTQLTVPPPQGRSQGPCGSQGPRAQSREASAVRCPTTEHCCKHRHISYRPTI
mmetsp:Transcript_27242/g.65616  ORF Transcript_27242/g.65616 Transcript_27242/m.65616 type:complete len:210 (-) Transcript_27242:279-908(-)